MKIIIFILLVGVLYAKNIQKPDSLVSTNNKGVNANIISIDDNIVKIETNKKQSDYLLESIDKIFVDTLGEVYNKKNGFIIKLTQLQNFLNSRYKNVIKEKERLRESINKQNIKSNQNNVRVNNLLQIKNSGNKKWSFSIIYSLGHKQIENYNFILSSIKPTPFVSLIYQTSTGEFESELTYKVFNSLQVAAFLGYSSASFNRRITTESDAYKNGIEEQNTLNRFLFEIGLKYYLGKLLLNNVTAFIVGTIGKQYAFSNTYSNTLFINPSYVYIIEDNSDSFIEDLNSPLLLTLGFGAEYFFNKSLSISGLLRYSYSDVSSEYHSKATSPSGSIVINKRTVRNAKLVYRTGLGINFYF